MSRRTTSRRELSRNPNFEQVSPEVGVIDEDAFADLLEQDPDEALTLLAQLSGATDEALRSLARQMAGRIVADLARGGSLRARGIGRLDRLAGSAAEGDVDLDASTDAIVAARSSGQPVDRDDLTVSAWRRPSTAVCLLVDRSGSMQGERLASATVAAASVLYRHSEDCSIIAFSDDALVLKAQDVDSPADEVVTDLLRLRGHGVTDLGVGLRAAHRQLDRSRAKTRIVILLSDCRSTTGGDPTGAAAALDELAIIAPADDMADAESLAHAIGARCAPLSGPSAVPEAVALALLVG